jgi:hypothetical protein
LPVPSKVGEDLAEDVDDKSDATEADAAFHNSLSLPVRFVYISFEFKVLGLGSNLEPPVFLSFLLPSYSSFFSYFSSLLIFLVSDDDDDIDGASCPTRSLFFPHGYYSMSCWSLMEAEEVMDPELLMTIRSHMPLPPLVFGLLWLTVLLVLAVAPADDGVLPTHLKLLLRPEGDGDDGLLPLVVSVSVLLLPIPCVDDAVDGLPLAEDPPLGGHAHPLGPDAGGCAGEHVVLLAESLGSGASLVLPGTRVEENR